METLYKSLAHLQERNDEIQDTITSSLTCENPKILEVMLEHILLRWDDIMELMMEELFEEEVQELNKIEQKRSPKPQPVQSQLDQQPSLAHKSTYGKYQDFKQVDLRDIMSLFEDYLSIENSAKNRL